MDTKEKYPVGTTVYYTLDDYDTGEPVIYSGKIVKITNQTLNLNGKKFPAKFYQLDSGLGMIYNSFYTIEELFQLKEKLELTMNEFLKDKLLSQEGGTNVK